METIKEIKEHSFLTLYENNIVDLQYYKLINILFLIIEKLYEEINQ
jgi:hypothetical protein